MQEKLFRFDFGSEPGHNTVNLQLHLSKSIHKINCRFNCRYFIDILLDILVNSWYFGFKYRWLIFIKIQTHVVEVTQINSSASYCNNE